MATMNPNERNYVNPQSLAKGAYKDSSEIEKRRALCSFAVPYYDIDKEVIGKLRLGSDGQKILDVGCGEGKFLNRAASINPNHQFFGVDISLGMFKQSRISQGKNISFTVGDSQALAFRDQTFDRVTAMHMLYHVPHISKAISEMARVLRPGGICLVTTNSIDSKPTKRMLKEKVASMLGMDKYPDPSERFNVEIGEEMFRDCFDDVRLILYKSMLILDDPEPYVEYYDSLRQFWNPLPDDAEWQRALSLVKAHIGGIIEKEGRFEEQNSFGLFVCSNPK